MGKRGETWLNWGKCGITELNVAHLGKMWVDGVKRALFGGKCDLTVLNMVIWGN